MTVALPQPPSTFNLGASAVAIFGDNPTASVLFQGASRTAPRSGQRGTSAAGFKQCAPVKTDWAYEAGTATNGHLRESIVSLGGLDLDNGGTVNGAPAWSGATAYVVGDQVLSGGSIYTCTVNHTNHVPPNAGFWSLTFATGSEQNPSPDGIQYVNGSHANGSGAGTVEFANTGDPTDYRDSALTVKGNLPMGDQGNVNDLHSNGTQSDAMPLSSKLRPRYHGDPFYAAKSFMRIVTYQSPNFTCVPSLRLLGRRFQNTNANPINAGHDNYPNIPAGTGFKFVDCQINSLAEGNDGGFNGANGRVGGYIGFNEASWKPLIIVSTGLYAGPNPVIPAGPRIGGTGKSGMSLVDHLLAMGDDLGVGATPTCSYANARSWYGVHMGFSGLAGGGGPTDVFFENDNRDNNVVFAAFGGRTELQALNAGDFSITHYLLGRLADKWRDIGLYLNGVPTRLTIITPEVAAYDANPYSPSDLQLNIARAKGWAAYHTAKENGHVGHLYINEMMGMYPKDGTSRPPWMDLGEPGYTHTSHIGQMYKAAFIIAPMQLAAFEQAGVPIDPAHNPPRYIRVPKKMPRLT